MLCRNISKLFTNKLLVDDVDLMDCVNWRAELWVYGLGGGGWEWMFWHGGDRRIVWAQRGEMVWAVLCFHYLGVSSLTTGFSLCHLNIANAK